MSFDIISDAYDGVYPRDFRKVPFVEKLLKKHKCKSILEIGSGSGIFTVPLAKHGFKIEGIEISREMIKVSHKKFPKLKVHKADMRNFRLTKKFDAVIAPSSVLVIAKNYREIKNCLKCISAHTKRGGIFMAELPNHPVEIRKSNGKTSIFFSKGKKTCVIIRSEKTKKYWREHWYIIRKKNGKIRLDYASYDELIYSPAKIEYEIKKAGFGIIERYGDLFGTKFDKNKSWRRVLICQKINS